MRNIIFLILFGLSLHLAAQNETNHWYFGNKAAMNFTGGIRSILNDSQMDAPYGTASMSDKQGNLLFYTDGATIWNKNHEIMQNGEGLRGDPNHTQPAIIIPRPDSDTDYYVFTTHESNGLQLHTVSFLNNTFGEVSVKNLRLTTHTTQRITAIHHQNGKDFWVISMSKTQPNSDATTFMVFKVNQGGVSIVPVRSDGPELSSNSGQLKITPNGKKLAVTTDQSSFQLYDFNTADGTITLDYDANMAINFSSGYIPSGVAFSQDSKVMYLAVEYYTSFRFAILRADLTKPFVPVDTPPFGLPIFTSDNYLAGSMQVALDGRIYVALSNIDNEATTLGVIDDPTDLTNSDAFRIRQIDLETGRSTRGLPNFIQSYFATRILTDNQCFVDPFTFTAESFTTISNIDWDFGDGNTGNGLTVNHTYAAPGFYTVKATLTINGIEVTVFKAVEAFELPVLNPNQELVECDDDLDGISIFNLFSIRDKISNPDLNVTLSFFNSQSNAIQNVNPITNPENYTNTSPTETIYVRAVNENSCFETEAFTIRSNFAQLDPVPDYFTCEVENGQGTFESAALLSFIRNNTSIPITTDLKLYPSYLEAQTNTNEFGATFNRISSTIYIKGFGQNDECVGITSMNVIVNPLPEIPVQDSYTICFDPSLQAPVVLRLDTSFDSYRWSNANGTIISTSNSLVLDRIGDFSVEVTKTENGITCTNQKSFTVVNPTKAIFGIIDVDTSDETNNTVLVNVIGNSTYQFSLDNVNFVGSGLSHQFSQVTPGIRTVYVKDQNNCEEPISVKISVIGFKSFFSPNGDGINDYWNITGLDSNSFKSVNITIYNRYGTIVGSISDFSSNGWDGTFNGKAQITSTYWYTAILVDNDDEVIKKTGNFSLVRE